MSELKKFGEVFRKSFTSAETPYLYGEEVGSKEKIYVCETSEVMAAAYSAYAEKSGEIQAAIKALSLFASESYSESDPEYIRRVALCVAKEAGNLGDAGVRIVIDSLTFANPSFDGENDEMVFL